MRIFLIKIIVLSILTILRFSLKIMLPDKKLIILPKYKFLRVFLIKITQKLQSFINYKINYKLSFFYDTKNDHHYVDVDGVFLDTSSSSRHLKLNNLHKINNEGKFFSNFLDKRKKLIVIDIGSNIGEISIYIAKNFRKAKIFSVEGSKETARVQQRNIFFNKVKNIKLINKIISNKSGKKYITRDHSTENFVLTKNDLQKVSANNFEFNACITLYNLVKENKISKIDFLKIDIEGSIPDIENDLINLWKKKKILNCSISFEKNTYTSYKKIIEELSKNADMYAIDTNSNQKKKISVSYLKTYLKKVLPAEYQGNRFQGLEVLFRLKNKR